MATCQNGTNGRSAVRRSRPPLRTFSVNMTGRPAHRGAAITKVRIHVNGTTLELAGNVSVNPDEGFGFVNLYPTADDYDTLAKAARRAKRHAKQPASR